MNNIGAGLTAKIAFFVLSCILVLSFRIFMILSKVGYDAEKRFRWLLFFRSINFIFLIGFALVNLQFPVWPSLDKLPVLYALIVEDSFNLVLVAGYFVFFLYQSYRIAQKFNRIQSTFGSYISQYAFFWLLMMNGLIFLRLDYFYIPLIPASDSSFTQIMMEILFAGIFLILQGLVLLVRRIKMVQAGPELQLLVKEVSQKIGVKIHQVKIWQLELVGNAFATGVFRHSIFLTESMTENVSQQDLEMIIGHECAHFKLHHLEMRMVVIAILIGLGSYFFEDLPDHYGIVLILFSILALLLYKRMARIHEYQADKLAADRLGGRQVMADALTRVFGINATPTRFDRFLGQWLSHPDLASRIRRLS